MNVHNFYASVVELWNEWEVRAMILLSLLLQIFLTITGSRRKYTAGSWLGTLVWLAYLSADWWATVTLGLLARSQEGSASNASFIPAFWAPMLLVHLGGPDSITAYAVEDNELWSRHLLRLATQLVLAFYTSLRSWLSKDPLVYLVIPIFVSGIIKYGERIWVLWLASSNKFRDSASEEGKSLLDQIDDSQLGTEPNIDINEVLGFNDMLSEAKYLHEAHFLFQTLKLLYADYLVMFSMHMSSYQILKRCKSATEAFKLIEVELGFMFDVLFTKEMTRASNLQLRFILRFINFLPSVSALLAFSIMTSRNFRAYSKSDIIISYLLLVGAIVLEIYSAILMLFSDWAMLWLSKQRKPSAISIYRFLSLSSNKKRYWKESMAQHELDNAYHYGDFDPNWEVVGDDLKHLIFHNLLDKRSRYDTRQMHEKDLKIILEQRGAYALKRKRCLGKLGRSVVEKDFHESFLIWHVATNTFFHHYSSESISCKMGISLSHYMMYLRIFSPFMLPKELGEAKYKLMNEGTGQDRLAGEVDNLYNSLNSLLRVDHWQPEQIWVMISEVFVEMLTYAASHCGWKEHAKALTQGGELLTFVAVLMAHLGFNQQCRYPETGDKPILETVADRLAVLMDHLG